MSDTPTPQSSSGFRTVASEQLELFTTGLVAGLGADHDIAAEVARHLVLANLSGHDSHGVIRLPQYATQVDSGALVPTARPGIILDGGAVTVFHAGRGFGQYSLSVGMDHALKRAREYGIAAVALRQCMHIGRLGDYAERAAAAGMITIVTVGSAGPGSGPVAAHGDHHRLLGTNPWCFGVPGGTQPFIFDAATSALAEGKVRVAKSKGVDVPDGVIVDTSGNPTNTPQDLYDGGALLPFGGDVARHKGYGLALASGLLGGLAAIGDPNPTMLGGLNTGPGAERRTGGVLLMALDPAAFGTPGQHGVKVAEVLSAITGAELPPEAAAAADAAGTADAAGSGGSGGEGALIPGTPEARSRKDRAATGIPIPASTWEELAALGDRLGVPLP